MNTGKTFIFFMLLIGLLSCNKDNNPTVPPEQTPESFSFNSLKVNGKYNGFDYFNVNFRPNIELSFTAPIQKKSMENNLTFQRKNGKKIGYTLAFAHKDSTVIIKPKSALEPITAYQISISTDLMSKEGGKLRSSIEVKLATEIDSSDKFPRISDSALLTLIQQQTFKYFWDFGHPVSGMARERNTSGDVCTTGGTGFGIMAILVGIHRHFISRAQGLSRMQKIVSFLKNKCTRYHGAFSHWINGATGETVPFSKKDDGADLVETSFLIQGLLCARQFFNQNNTEEKALRDNINALWNEVEWNWFRQGGQNVLYWHWSPNYAWDMNMKITGWNEALIVYVLAASSNKDSIPKIVYDNGWAKNGNMKNGNKYLGVKLPLGSDYGGPLFFSHYSFLGLNPHGLSDAYANYWTQNVAHTTINYLYCVNNPKDFNGYSKQCWGLTASDDNNGYKAHSPTSDDGVVSPTAAISSIPYTPEKSMKALKFFYYKIGDKLWGNYGFSDAFNLTDIWFADSYLAIDQGPQIIMIENYRSGLLWSLFMSCPEIKRGLKRLGFAKQ